MAGKTTALSASGLEEHGALLHGEVEVAPDPPADLVRARPQSQKSIEAVAVVGGYGDLVFVGRETTAAKRDHLGRSFQHGLIASVVGAIDAHELLEEGEGQRSDADAKARRDGLLRGNIRCAGPGVLDGRSEQLMRGFLDRCPDRRQRPWRCAQGVHGDNVEPFHGVVGLVRDEGVHRERTGRRRSGRHSAFAHLLGEAVHLAAHHDCVTGIDEKADG